MANAPYTAAKTWVLEQALLQATIRAVLVDLDGYTFSDSHATLADVPAEARLAVSAGMAGKNISAGALSVAGYTFSNPSASAPSAGVVYFIDTGSEATSVLLGYQDQFSEGVLTVTAGVDVNINGHNCLSIG